MPTIDPSLYLKNQPQTRGVPDSNLGKDDFLKILMTQIQNQDPTNPMDDREFISQLAQFSSLEQTMNMANAIQGLVQSQHVNPIVQHSHLIGKTVTYQNYDEETEKWLPKQSSEVIGVSQVDGYAILELANGESVYADFILEIKDTNASNESPEDGIVDEETE
ncbi:flagellar hook assembly protein FlgD [Ornithinibacillus sp. 179-J 7C1 HS]|uniref:flagellar hook assembly protein FlgD n=1 Tax=Ornithinibacillus sp. 179-J 7C1 HS TaxID=3142384 RepID=UPI00399F4E4A